MRRATCPSYAKRIVPFVLVTAGCFAAPPADDVQNATQALPSGQLDTSCNGNGMVGFGWSVLDATPFGTGFLISQPDHYRRLMDDGAVDLAFQPFKKAFGGRRSAPLPAGGFVELATSPSNAVGGAELFWLSSQGAVTGTVPSGPPLDKLSAASVATSAAGDVFVAGWSQTPDLHWHLGVRKFAGGKDVPSYRADVDLGVHNAINVALELGQLVVDGDAVLVGVHVGSPEEEKIVRFDASGALDASFGTGGVLALEQPGFSRSSSFGVDSAHRVLTAGFAPVNLASPALRLRARRYLPDGKLDTTFGSAGTATVTTAFMSSSEARPATFVQSGDRLVIAASAARIGAPGSTLVVTRLDAAGALDTTFGTAGIANVDLQPAAIASQFPVVTGNAKRLIVGGAVKTATGMNGGAIVCLKP